MKSKILKVKSDLKNLGAIRKFLISFLEQKNVKKEIIASLALALTELCENLIKYGYKEKKGDIKIQVIATNKNIKINILDKGEPFDISNYKPPDIKQNLKKGIGGKMGIKIIKLMCDKIIYNTNRGINKTTLVKYK